MLFRTGLYVKDHSVEKVQVASTPIASYNGNVTGLNIPEIVTMINAIQASGTPSPNNVIPIYGRTCVRVGNDANYGGLIDFNQMVQNGDFADSSIWNERTQGCFSVNDGVGTITAQVASNANQVYQGISAIIGHKYIIGASLKKNAGSFDSVLIGLFSSTTRVAVASFTPNSSFDRYYSIVTPASSASSFRFSIYGNVAINDSFSIKDLICIDLTQAFGETKADEIYAMEQATAGSGVAYVRSLFYRDYYAYTLTSIKTLGEINNDNTGISVLIPIEINQWDETWEKGIINLQTGENATNANQIRSKGYIQVTPNETYYFSNQAWVVFYDENYSIVTSDLPTGSSSSYYGRFLNQVTFKAPITARYMRFYCVANYGNTYKNDISVNYPATETSYKPSKGIGLVYVGYLDLTTGLLTILAKYFEFNAATYYGTYGVDDAPLFYVDITDEGVKRMDNSGREGILISNMLSKISASGATKMKNYEIRTDADNVPSKLYFRIDSCTSQADIDTFFADKTLQVVAELQTPIEVQLSPKQIEQLLVNNVAADSGNVAVKFYNVIR